MHLANGTVSNEICTVTAALSTASVLYAASRLRSGVTRSHLLKASIGAAIVFVAQMYDVPLFGSVGVHLIGAAFLTLLAGPALALLGMTTVIVIQALAWNDGGIAPLGANVLNMAVIGVVVSTLVTRMVRARLVGSAGLMVAAALASVASVLAAVSAMSIELAASGTPALSALGLTMPAHASFAAWETLTTLALVAVAARLRVVEPVAIVSASR